MPLVHPIWVNTLLYSLCIFCVVSVLAKPDGFHACICNNVVNSLFNFVSVQITFKAIVCYRLVLFADWSFIEKTSVKRDLKCKVCSNFHMSFLHLDRWTPTVEEALSQVDIFAKSLGQADLWSDICPRTRLWVRLTFLSDLQVRLTFCQMYPTGLGYGSG